MQLRARKLLTHHITITVAVLTFLLVLFFWRLLTPVQQDRVLFARGDFTLHYYSFSSYQVERLWQGHIPLWNPYNYGGDPFAANVQWVTWYPPRWIAAFLARSSGWTIESLQLEVAAHYWLASLMMYAFLSTLVRRKGAALIGSVIFTYGGYLTGYPLLQVSVLESIVWLPLLMLGVQLALTPPPDPLPVYKEGEKSFRRIHLFQRIVMQLGLPGLILGCIAIGLSFLAGHPQTTVQMIYCALAYLLVSGRLRGVSWLGIFIRAVLLVGIGGGLAAVQLLPAGEFTTLSARVGELFYDDKSNGFAVADYFQMLVPTLSGTWSPLYVGVAGFLLALSAVMHAFRSRWAFRRYAFWIGVIVIGLLLALGGGSIVYDFFYVFVPGVNTFRQQERIAALVAFALSVLAAYQVDVMLRGLIFKFRTRCIVSLHTAHFFIAALLFLIYTLLKLAQGEFISSDVTANALGFVALMSLLFTGWFAWHRRYQGAQWHIIGVLLTLIVVDLFTIGTRTSNYMPDTAENRVAPPALIETLRADTASIQWHVDGAGGLQGHGTYFRIPDIYGTGPFALASMEGLRTIPVDRFWEVLAVRYVTAIEEPPVDIVPLELLAYGVNYDGVEYRVFELLNPRPFAHLVYDVRVAENNPVFAREIMSDSRVNLREMAVTTEPLPFELSGVRPADSAVTDFVMVTPELFEMTLSTSENALLTLALANYPGWRATINGAPVDIIDTYAGLVGVPILPGDNQRVVLEFVPITVILGGVISSATMLAIILAIGSVGLLSRRIKHAPMIEA